MPAPDPSLALYNEVRAAFILKGSSLGAWCRKNGFRIQNARATLTGTWNGPAGRKLRARICKEAGIGSQP